jgi:RHS repeat-associated protein
MLVDAQDRMLRFGGGAYQYTPNGELARKIGSVADTTRYSYDSLGNLLGMVLPSGDTLRYMIDGLGRRVGRAKNGSMTSGWLYQDAGRVVAELDGSGSVVSRFIYGSQGHVPDLVVRGDSTYRLITDHLGSVRAVVNIASGSMPQRVDYDVWGRRTYELLASFQPFGFAGGLTDSLAGLIKFGVRNYDPMVGRWISKDPVLFEGGDVNLYAYCASSPVAWVDPVGKARETSPTGQAGGAYKGLTPEQIINISLCTGAKVGASAGGGFGGEVEKLQYLIDLVANGHPLDLKGTKYVEGMTERERDMLGNFNFGVLGAVLGYDDYVLLKGAGVYDLYTTAKLLKQLWKEKQFGKIIKELSKPRSEYWDDADDTRDIQAGIAYARACPCTK